MEAAACAQPASAGSVYSRRQPEKTALYRVMQEYLLTFEQQWTDQASGRSLPKFVTDELHGFMSCGILGRGFAHLYCKTCREHYAVAFSCKARAVCPSCLGRRMNEGALNLVDHVLPDVPLRQFVLTMPFPLRPVSTLRRSPSSRVLQLSSHLLGGMSSDILAYFRHTPLHAATSSPSPPSPRLRLPSRTSPRTHRGTLLGPNFCAVRSGSKFYAPSASFSSACSPSSRLRTLPRES